MMSSLAASRGPVVVVGAGPAGLTTAATLGRHGVAVVVVERRSPGSELPRATALSLRSMEIFRSWGLEAQLLDGSAEVEMTLLEVPSVARAAEGRRHEVGFPTAAQADLVSPTRPACVPQDHLEAVLLEHLATLPSVSIMRGVEVTDLEDRGHEVVVRLVDGRVHRTVVASYVVGADGARSRVREVLGIPLDGPDRLVEGVRAEVRADLWALLGPHRHGIYAITGPDAVGTLLPTGPGDRWLFGIEWVGDPRAGERELRRRFTHAVGVAELPARFGRTHRFSSSAKVATTFSRGRVHLVGDAAHQATPRGGTGLNTAVHDGYDLGWRLAWTVLGWADDTLLAGYERERRPVAVHTVERSADPAGSRRTVVGELQVDLGGRLPHVWVGERSTLDLLGHGLTAFLGPDADPPRTPGSGPPLTVVRLPVMTARALGLGRGGRSIVRPDGVAVDSRTPHPSHSPTPDDLWRIA